MNDLHFDEPCPYQLLKGINVDKGKCPGCLADMVRTLKKASTAMWGIH